MSESGYANEETRALLRLQAWTDKGRRFMQVCGKVNNLYCVEVCRPLGNKIFRAYGATLAEAINKALDQAEAAGG